jgi:hypothetical protein
MKITRIELYCKDEAVAAVLRALMTVKGVLADPPPHPIPTDIGQEEEMPPTKKKGPRAANNDTNIQDQVLDVLANRLMTNAEIAEETGLDKEQVANATDRLRRRGLLRKMAKHRYKKKGA